MAKEVRALSDFERQLKKLSKNRHGLKSDYKDFVVNLEASHQNWDRVGDAEGAPLWTSRMQDSSSNRGKSGGFRVYFFNADTEIWLVHIQLRKDGDTVPAWTLLRALKRAGLWPPSENLAVSGFIAHGLIRARQLPTSLFHLHSTLV